MTYKFTQFNVQIVNPTITINLNTISDKAIDKLLSVDLVLTTENANFGVTATDMPYDISWNDSDISHMVDIWLSKYAI